jgi:hypothetical protein
VLKDVSVVDCSTGGRFHHSSAGAHLGTSLPLRLLESEANSTKQIIATLLKNHMI